MAALDFPDNPTNGQVYDKWTWDGTMWVLTAGGAGSGFTFMQDAVPTATAVKQTWFETDTGASYVWSNDGNSTQWVQYAPGGGSGGGGSGFTFVSDVKPTAAKVGDTWFDISTAASGGTSWVAIEEGALGSELVWVQFAPGSGGTDSMPKGLLKYLPSTDIAVTTLTPTWTVLQTTSVPLVANRNYVAATDSLSTWISGGVSGSSFSVNIFLDGTNYGGRLAIDTVLSGGYIPQPHWEYRFKAPATKATTVELRAYKTASNSGTMQARFDLAIMDEGANV